MNVAEALVRALEAEGIDIVFGVPGTHTLELYRALAASGIRHVLPRHEQGAGFMADGYARASGKPGVCFLIAGPGVLNAATPIAQAWSDSVPMLIISSEVPASPDRRYAGQVHELRSQQAILATITAFSEVVRQPADLPALLARAFATFRSGRPRPVHIAVPVDLMRAAAIQATIEPDRTPEPSAADESALLRAARLLASARRPLIIAGGGALDCGATIVSLAERTGAGVMTTIAAKGLVPDGHRLHYGAPLILDEARRIAEAADVVLAAGTELAASDTWTAPLNLPGTIIRVDIDPEAFRQIRPGDEALWGDSRQILPRLDAKVSGLDAIPSPDRQQGTPSSLRAEWRAKLSPLQRRHARLLGMLASALPTESTIAADTAQIAYTANLVLPCARPRSYFYPVGLSTLGFALPVAIGAKLAAPAHACVALSGDYGFQYTAGELATAAELGLPVVVIVWNNGGLGQIRMHMRNRQQPPVGVDTELPDLMKLAQAHGCRAVRPASLVDFGDQVRAGLEATVPTVIEVKEDDPWLA